MTDKHAESAVERYYALEWVPDGEMGFDPGGREVKAAADAAIAELEAKLAASEQAREMAEDRERQTAFVLGQEKAGHALTDKAREQAEAEVKKLRHFNTVAIHADEVKTAEVVRLQAEVSVRDRMLRLAWNVLTEDREIMETLLGTAIMDYSEWLFDLRARSQEVGS